MKTFKLVLFILALLSMPVSAFIMGQFWLGLTFSVFYVIFGIIEVMAKLKSGKTVSHHVRSLPLGKRWIVISCMILGWGALILHFLNVL